MDHFPKKYAKFRFEEQKKVVIPENTIIHINFASILHRPKIHIGQEKTPIWCSGIPKLFNRIHIIQLAKPVGQFMKQVIQEGRLTEKRTERKQWDKNPMISKSIDFI